LASFRLALKDPADPSWRDDQGVKDYMEWIHKYYPGDEANDYFVIGAYSNAQALVYLIEHCGDDLSRQKILYQATSLHNVSVPLLLPGITLNTSPAEYQPINELRETRFNGKVWEYLSNGSGN
jgi:branched-chain amino acid transport system substrate-binding protein